MNNNGIYDVAVIGGGLAGLTTAIQCANIGYNTLLIEKEVYPFHKVCGEYISMESFDFLQRLGLPLAEWNLPVIDRLNISDAKGNIYNFNLPLGGFGISRFTLDDALYTLARHKGVQVLTKTKATNITFNNNLFIIETNGEKFTAKCVTGAFGKRSNMDVKLQRPFIRSKASGLNNYIGVKYHVRYPQPKNLIALHNFSNGYCGISNIEGDKCCLCYLTTAHNLRKSGNSIQQMERDILMQNPQLNAIFANAEFLYDSPLTISQISFAKKSQVQGHILMTGDAAGMITPLCGNGMSMAMHAGKLAFNSMHQFLQGNINRQMMEQQYAAQWHQQFSRRLLAGRLVQRLFGNNSTTSVFLKVMSKNAWLAQKVISSTHGRPF